MEVTSNIQLSAFESRVNIGLFNDIIEFAAGASENPSAVLGHLASTHLWYSNSQTGNIQQKYGFRYFGELLERYEDRIGSDIADTRAIALAMAYTKDLLTDEMFVGKQKNDFLRKITKLSDTDIYLKGALCQLGKGETDVRWLLDDLVHTAYVETQDLLFVMSLFDDFEQAFTTFKPQLIRLLSAERTIAVNGNTAIFCWLIKRLRQCPGIKGIRTKDMALFRALMELPVSFVKAGSRHHSILLNNGYTALDIVFLNSIVIRFRPTRDTLDLDSIVSEKIAVAMCTIFINSDNAHTLDAYEHLTWLLKKYSSFAIKIGGYNGIYDAIKGGIKFANPQTFLWLYKLIEPKDLFRFDVMNEKWDVLSKELSSDSYLWLFNRELVDGFGEDLPKTQPQELIQKYEMLTGLSYLAQFEHEHKYDRESAFAVMVKSGIINLVDKFESCPDIKILSGNYSNEDKSAMLEYIEDFIEGIRSREAFDFFRYFLNKYSFDDMHKLFAPKGYGRSVDYIFVNQLYKGWSNSYNDRDKSRFDITRSFLSNDEHRELFGWLDDYMFRYKANGYSQFAALMLADDFISSLYPHDELRSIYNIVKDTDCDFIKSWESYSLKKKYLTEDELQAESDAKEAQEKERKRIENENLIQSLKDKLISIYDGSFASLHTFLDKRENSWQNKKEALTVAAEFFVPTLTEKEYALCNEEISHFLNIATKLFKSDMLTFDCFKNHISKVVEIKEEIVHAENE